MVELNAQDLRGLKEFLAKFDFESALPQLAGLLTVPSLQANTIRIEAAVHLAVACCRGSHLVGRAEIERLLNGELAAISYLEDPVEDVFIANVITPGGNRRLFQGVWKANDHYAQDVIDVLLSCELPGECVKLLEPISALLRISEEIARRMDLRRWQSEPSTPQADVQVPLEADLRRATRALTFSESQLLELGIDPDLLDPFVLNDSDKRSILTQTIGHTSLERRPLVRIGKGLICALPQSVSPAIRRFVVGELRRTGHLRAFARALAELQFDQVETELHRELRKFTTHDNFPEPGSGLPSLHSLAINYDIDKYLHVLFIHGVLNLIEEHGFSGSKRYPTPMVQSLEQYMERVANWCKSQPSFRDGTTLLVIGGLGEPSTLGFRPTVAEWQFSIISLPDLDMLTSENERPLTQYLKFLKQRAWIEEKGCRFVCFEDYSLYCYWRQTDYLPVPRQLPLGPNSICQVLGDSAKEVRTETRSLVDWHVVPSARGRNVLVMRFRSDSILASERHKPIYASPSSVAAGLLAGVIETTHGVSWLTASTRPGQSLLHQPYEIWEGFFDLFEGLVAGIEEFGLNRRSDPIEVRLDCSNVGPLHEQAPSEPLPTPSEPEVAIDPDSGLATVSLPAHFLHFFRQPHNTGERLVVRSIARGLVGLHRGSNGQSEAKTLDSLTDSLTKDPGLRVIHAFRTSDPVEIIRHKKLRDLTFLSQMDYRFLNVGLCDSISPRREHDLLESKECCNTFLHKIVDLLCDRVRTALRVLDRASVIREMLETAEAVIADRLHWTRTARAMIALHSESENVFSAAGEREEKRASTALSARSIIEVAICECPSEGGREISSWESDELLATMLLMINTAARSDAIHHDLAEPRIELFANGEYDMDLGFQERVMSPFLEVYNRGRFVKAADDYEHLYGDDEPVADEQAGNAFPDELVTAFQAEFGLTLLQARRGIGELIDLAIHEGELVVQTTVGHVRTRLIQNCEYTREDCDVFFHTFGLLHRSNWEEPPDGMSKKDIFPWRYSRRLSVVVRPLLLFGERDDDRAFYSVSMLKDGFTYLLGKIMEGHLSQDFFASSQMKSYIGRVNDNLGHVFEKEVAATFGNRDWKVRQRLSMSELGAPAQLGDIDVLAWKADGRVSVVECKRLQLARTLAEIAEVCRRFRGEARDELDKHLQRLRWIKKSPASLKQVVGFAPDVEQIGDWIVTSNEVPFRYLNSLPIEPQKIVPLSKLRF